MVPKNNTDRTWGPGKYDKESWVKYSNLDGEFTKVRRAMPIDQPGYRFDPTLTNYQDKFIIMTGGTTVH